MFLYVLIALAFAVCMALRSFGVDLLGGMFAGLEHTAGHFLSVLIGLGLTAIVGKASAGALEYMPVARVTNITNAIKELKERGVWIFGTAAEGATPLYQADFKGAAAIVIGNEGDGMSRLVAESCDLKVSIPMKGRISSLNASAAAAILLYEAVRQRG